MPRLACRVVLFFVLIALSLSVRSEEAAPKTAPATTPAPTPAPAPAPTATTPLPSPSTPAAPVVAPEIVVVGSIEKVNPEQQGISTNVINADEIRASQDTSAAEVLRNTPGAYITTSGRKGTTTNLSIRGGNNNQTEIQLNGFRVNRQGGGYDFDALGTIGLDRIEISRGPSSALFGTGAVTGVFNAVTKKGEGPLTLTASGAAGTYGTDRETLQLEGSFKKFNYNVAAARERRDNATEDNSELQTYNYVARLGYDITEDHEITFFFNGKNLNRGFYESVSLATQLGTSVVPTDPNDTIENRELLAGLEYHGKIFPIWETWLRAGHYETEHNFDFPQPTPPQNFLLNNPMLGGPRSAASSSKDDRDTLEWRNRITALDIKNIKNYVTVGVLGEKEKFDQDDTVLFANVNRDQTNVEYYLQDRLELFDRAYIEAGIRHQDHDIFGSLTTGRGNASILIPESDTRVFGSVGSAYRAPSFFELFAPNIGNPALTPEYNFAYDFGVEQKFWKNRIVMSGTYFHNDFRDFITLSNAPPFRSSQFRNTTTRGVEAQFKIDPVKQLSFQANATFLHTEDDGGERLLRRPAQTYSARLIARPLVGFVEKKHDGLEIAFDLLRVGSRTDLGPGATFAFNPFDVQRSHNDPYTRLDLAVSYRFFEHFRAFVKFENLTDEKYEDELTFPTDGANVLGGLEFNWRF